MTALALQVGQKARRSLTLTRAEVEAYARITGDYNPRRARSDMRACSRIEPRTSRC